MLSSRKDQYWSRKAKEVSAKRKKNAALFDRRTLKDMKTGYDRWLKEVYAPWVDGSPEVKERFETASGIPLKPIYTPDDIASLSQSDMALPGVYPYTQGRLSLDVSRAAVDDEDVLGLRDPEDTNKRLKLLLAHGETGLSVAFDMPTLYGYDCDSREGPRRGREVRGQRLLAPRHGGDLRRDPARQGQHFDDDQRPRRGPHRDVRGRREGAGASRCSRSRGPSRRTC